MSTNTELNRAGALPDAPLEAAVAAEASGGTAGGDLAAWLLGRSPAAVIRWILATCVVLAIASDLRWATVSANGVSVPIVGLQGTYWDTPAGGWVPLVAAVLVAGLVLLPQLAERWRWGLEHRWILSQLLAWVALFVCVVNLVDVQDLGTLSAVATPAWGLYLAAAASASLVVWTFVVCRQSRQESSAPPPSEKDSV